MLLSRTKLSTRASLLTRGVLAALMGMPVAAHAGLFTSAEEIATAWIGHEAADLLMQWTVSDDVRFSTSENAKTHETAYTYYFAIPAHYTFNYWTENTGNIIGMTPGGGGVASMPIFEQVQHVEKTYHPLSEQCNVTFIADVQGIIRRYDFRGSNCKPYFRRWGKPEAP